MKKIMTVCLVLAMALVVGTASADFSWQTKPVLGTSTYYTGDVIVVTDSGLINIPHYVMDNGIQPTGMNVFTVGQTVDAGSGINVDDWMWYQWSVVYTGPSRTVKYEYDYYGDSGEGFVMNYLDPLSTLTQADVGWWDYTETWKKYTDYDNKVFGDSIDYSTDFRVVVPAPGALLLGSMGMGLVGWMRRRHSL